MFINNFTDRWNTVRDKVHDPYIFTRFDCFECKITPLQLRLFSIYIVYWFYICPDLTVFTVYFYFVLSSSLSLRQSLLRQSYPLWLFHYKLVSRFLLLPTRTPIDSHQVRSVSGYVSSPLLSNVQSETIMVLSLN